MLRLDLFENDPERVINGLKAKKVEDAKAAVQRVIELNKQRKALIQDGDSQRAELNTISKQIGQLMREGNKDEAEAVKSQTTNIKQSIGELDEKLNAVSAELDTLLLRLPNLPHESVPEGHDENDNVVVRESAHHNTVEGDAKPHWEIVEQLGIVDFELGAKISGAGFPVYIGQGAQLQRALINFFLARAAAKGYTEVQPPHLINEASGIGTGQIPDKDGQMYEVTRDGLYLIPTAEVPVTNIFRDTIIEQHQLPKKLCAYSPCFRREAGSYGKDVRGLNRLHQFDKVEIVQVVEPENSYKTLERMVSYVESLLQELGLQYRVLLLSTGDCTSSSAKTYDMEVWSAAQERWLEVSSISNFECYQARRMQLRYRPEGEKQTRNAHSLNGSALALPRIVAAIIENYQQADGTIQVPPVLQTFTGFDTIERAAHPLQ